MNLNQPLLDTLERDGEDYVCLSCSEIVDETSLEFSEDGNEIFCSSLDSVESLTNIAGEREEDHGEYNTEINNALIVSYALNLIEHHNKMNEVVTVETQLYKSFCNNLDDDHYASLEVSLVRPEKTRNKYGGLSFYEPVDTIQTDLQYILQNILVRVYGEYYLEKEYKPYETNSEIYDMIVEKMDRVNHLRESMNRIYDEHQKKGQE